MYETLVLLYFQCPVLFQPQVKASLTVTVGDYTFTVKANGVVEEATPATVEQAVVGEIVTGENKPYTKNGTAEIPVGFAIVPGLDDVSEGLVISDDPNGQSKKILF